MFNNEFKKKLLNALEKNNKQAVDEVFQNNPAEAVVREFNLYKGVEDEGAKFFIRMGKHKNQKVKIADYLMRPDDEFGTIPSFSKTEFETLFIECGTTLVPFTGQLAETIAESTSKIDRLWTNSLFGLTALVNRISRVSATPGSFDTKYFGFFPFFADQPTKNNDIQSEDVGYHTIAELVEQSDIVLATCSNFSFLAGPLVGSRENAISKHAIFTRGKQIVIALNFEKLIPVNKLTKQFYDLHSVFSGSLSKCFHVFSRPQKSGFFPKSLKAADLNINDDWHIGWIKQNQNDVRKVFGENLSQRFEKGIEVRTILRFEESWLEQFQTRDIRLLISLPLRDESTISASLARDFILDQVRLTNEFLFAANKNFHFGLPEFQELSDEFQVVEVVKVDGRYNPKTGKNINHRS